MTVNLGNHVLQTFLSKRRLKRDLAKDIVEVFYEKVNSQQNTERVFDSLSSSLKVSLLQTAILFHSSNHNDTSASSVRASCAG